MPFTSGSVTFRTLRVVGESKLDAPAVIEKIKEHIFQTGEISTEEVEYGWAGARHILDNEITLENNVFNNAVLFSLRVDTNKVPADVKNAWKQTHEADMAKENPSGFLSKIQKREAKDWVKRSCDDAIKTGKYRKTKVVPLLWDLDKNRVYSNANNSAFEKLAEIFQRSFGLDLVPMDSGTLAERYADNKGVRKQYEDLRPTRFVNSPAGDDQFPEYPWVLKAANPKNFLGNEFLMWLWYTAAKSDGFIPTIAGTATIFLDRSLDLDCAYGHTGKESLRGDGPGRSPEAMAGLRVGKVPRKAYMIINMKDEEYRLNLTAETMTFGGVTLPEVEDAETPRVLFESRITMLDDLTTVMSNLYGAFLGTRLGNWEQQTVKDIRQWIQPK